LQNENKIGYVLFWSILHVLKNKDTWYRILGEFSSRIKYSLESIQWAVSEKIFYTISVWRNWNGNRYVAYLYGNASKRNLNLNNWDEDWNDNYRFLVFRNSLYFLSKTPFI
jgi:hypothetical protein